MDTVATSTREPRPRDFERLYRLQVEELHDYALFLINTDGIITSWNAGVGTILQYRSEEFVGKPLADIFTLEDRESGAPLREMQTAARQGRAADVRWHLRKDGSRIFAEGVLYAIREGDGPLLGYSKVMMDATARHQAEEAIRRSRDDLAEFAHVVSHDLQAPLRTMRSYAQLLAKRYSSQLDESADTFIAFMLEGAQNMEELIRGLLDYAEFGQDRERRAVSLAEVIETVTATTLKIPIEECGAQITWGSLPEVNANPTQIQQVLQNLIGNAIKYRSHNVPAIRVEAEDRDFYWLVSVKDNGVGIAPEHFDRVFLPLKRLHGREIAGTGLGLAVCKRIIESNGGRIWVESREGEGSTFFFTLPKKNPGQATEDEA